MNLCGMFLGLLGLLPLTPPVRLTFTPGLTEIGLTHRNAWVDSGGTVWIATQDRDGLTYRIVLVRWDGTQALLDTVRQGSADSKWPSLTPFQDSLAVVWHDYRVAGIQNVELFGRMRSLLDGGWGPEERLTYTHAANGGDNSYVPPVWAQGDTLRVGWYDFRENPARASVYFKQRAVGLPWDSLGDVRVNADTSGQAWFPAVIPEPGGFTVFWADDRSGVSQIWGRSYRYGTGWSPSQHWWPSSTAQAYPAAARCGGVRAVVWEAQGIRGRTEGGSEVAFSPTGHHPDLVPAGRGCWVVWAEDRALAGVYWIPPDTLRDTFYLLRPAPLAPGAGYAGPDAFLTPDGRLGVVWAETLPDEPGNTDLFLTLSLPTGVAASPVSPGPAVDIQATPRGWRLLSKQARTLSLRDLTG
ncbi:MAG: hypothetical protein L3J76_02220, partial [Candidatus Hydrothermae bacterium]|nr:hypothetical protein [Candidatus Hydrothermae bacterium]